MKKEEIKEMLEEKNSLMKVVEELKGALKQGFTILGVSDRLLLLDCGIKACELFTEESFLNRQKENWENWKGDEALQEYTFEDFLEFCVWGGDEYSDINLIIDAYEERMEELDELLCV